MEIVADYYQRFAELEARGVSAIYEDWGLGVAGDAHVQSLIAALPRHKQQANLVFAAARSQGAPLDGYDVFREWLDSAWTEVVPVIMARSTQTNEAARCATLLPQIASIPGPVALLEVGASAGLCLYPDRYSYRFTSAGARHDLDPQDGPSTVVLDCALSGPVDLPVEMPEVVWRGGIDLNPIDVTDSESVDWLEALIWPEHDARRERLHAATGVVANDPPLLVAGDLNMQIADLASRAPGDATLVIFHSAVLVYLDVEQRRRFVDQVSRLDAVWLSNEGSRVLPETTAQIPAGIEQNGDLVLGRDGVPVALTAPHGQYYRGLPAT